MTRKDNVTSHSHEKYERLIGAAKDRPALPTAVAHPCDAISLRGAFEAAKTGSMPLLSSWVHKLIYWAASRIGLRAGLRMCSRSVIECRA
jgi:hypothetical protein